MKNSFCVLPWIHRFINVDGKVGVCCTSEEFDNLIIDNNGKEFNAHFGIDENQIQNSDFLKSIRNKMLKGELPDFCLRCLQTEESGGKSRRQVENENFKDKIDDILKHTSSDGETTIPISSLDLRPGNVCNLACRMCNPRSSTTWIKEWNSLKTQPFYLTEDLKREFMSYDWYKNPDFINYIFNNINKIEHFHFAGGEPLILNEVVNILEKISQTNHAKNIHLSFNTNLTIIPDKIKFILPKFKSTQLLISIDGYSKVNDLIRYPSKWSTLENNLKFIDENHQSLNISEAIIMTTVQNYNIFKLNELYQFTEKFNFIQKLPILIDLYYPSYYSTQVLTAPQKELATKLLRELYHQFNTKYPAHPHLESLLGCIQFMNKSDESKNYAQFLKAVIEKDKLRNENTFDLIPELLPFDAT